MNLMMFSLVEKKTQHLFSSMDLRSLTSIQTVTAYLRGFGTNGSI